MIHDHVSGSLSALDREVVRAVPPGGNWRNLGLDFASRRIEQIRRGAAEGKGSRSTYYGRLRWDRPSYTVSTYFNRPGNGCYIHPEHPRLISVREGARLQSFPDAYRFSGNGRDLFMQVGNAVPPILAYQLGRMFEPGTAVDLFAGAGGLALGLELAGHTTVVAADLDGASLSTFQANRPAHEVTLAADLSDPHELARVTRAVTARLRGDRLDLLVGGPPCQGFSTAGFGRPDDPRNRLVFAFLEAVEHLRPLRVLMENVPAIMWRGRKPILDAVRQSLSRLGYESSVRILHAEGYGVPQLRRRLFIQAARGTDIAWPLPGRAISPPAQLQYQPGAGVEMPTLSPALTVRDAIGDLSGDVARNGESLPYPGPPETPYQAWSRGDLAIDELVPPSSREYGQLRLFQPA